MFYTPRRSSLRLDPLIFTPQDIPLLPDLDTARSNPSLTVLSALCHAGHPKIDQMFPALAEALRSVERSQKVSYYDAVLVGLPNGVRTRWRDS